MSSTPVRRPRTMMRSVSMAALALSGADAATTAFQSVDPSFPKAIKRVDGLGQTPIESGALIQHAITGALHPHPPGPPFLQPHLVGPPSQVSFLSPAAPTTTPTTPIATPSDPTVHSPSFMMSGPPMHSGNSTFLPIPTSPSASSAQSPKHTNLTLILGCTIGAIVFLCLTIAVLVYLVRRRGTRSAAHGASLLDRILRGFTPTKITPFRLHQGASHSFTQLMDDRVPDRDMIEGNRDHPPVHTGVILITASSRHTTTLCSDDHSLWSDSVGSSDAVASSTVLGDGQGPDCFTCGKATD